MFYIDDNLKLIIKFNDKIESLFDYENSLIGNIYRGRVEKVVKSLNAAFVNIGLEDNAYMSLKDATKDISEGEDILCQIKKLPPENKAPKLTMELSIGGKYIVYFPKENFVKFSSKLSFEEIYDLKKLNLKGVLYRTMVKEASNEEILKEYNFLKVYGEKLLLEENRLPTPKKLYYKNTFLDYLFKNASKENIITNNKEIYKDLKNNFNIEYSSDFSIIYNKEILMDYKSLFNRKVEISNGSNIVIDRAESLTAIDVNTASFVGNSNFEETAFQNNMIAAKEIVRQIILRNISGIIIVDFIDMKSKAHKDSLLKFLRKEFELDSSKTIVHGYTKLNLIEISRKNNGEEIKLKV